MTANEKKLLVPISLEALMVNKNGNAIKYAECTPTYDLLRYSQVLGESMAQECFKTKDSLEQGLHLHWALPDSLTRGFQTCAIDTHSFQTHLVNLHPNISGDDVNKILNELKANRFLDTSNVVTRRFIPGKINQKKSAKGGDFTLGLSDPYSDYEQDVISYFQESMSKGEIEYPAAPDRWYVLRIFTEYENDGAYKKTSLRAWIIESNHAISDPEAGKGRITIPAKKVSDETFYALYVGRKSDYKNWTLDVQGNYIDKITAIGAGDPMFAAYYPNCKTVFGFHDPFINEDNNEETKGFYTYMIAGWYSNVAQDPLTGNVNSRLWDSCMQELRWSVPEEIKDQPKGILCHGMIYNIGWNGHNYDYGNSIPKENPEIVWGQTSIEALCALMKSKLLNEQQDVARILEAFNYELLSEFNHPDGIQKLEEKIHEKSFSPLKGGIKYVINHQNKNDNDSAPDTTKPFPGTLGSDLDQLNTYVRYCEDIQRKISDLQWEVYSCWFKYVSDRQSPMSQVSIVLCNDIVDKIGDMVNDYKSQASGLNFQIDTLSAKIRQEIETIKEMRGYRLETITRNSFWQPNDPVLLFSGSGLSRSFRHGYDHQYSSDGKLKCRSTEYTLTGMTVTPKDKPVTVTSEDLFALIDPFPTGQEAVPDEIRKLLAETLLLDTHQSKLIAVAAFKSSGIENPLKSDVETLATQIEKIQTLIWNACLIKNVSAQQLADAVGLEGLVPDKIGVTFWAQAWVPMFMEWSVNISKCNDLLPNFSNILNKWTLGDIDYAYSADEVCQNVAIQTQGSVIITPHAPHNMQKALQNYIEKLDPEDPVIQELSDIRDQFGKLDILSQTMSGFNNSLIMRKETLQFPVFDFNENDSDQHPSQQQLAKKVATLISGMNNLSPMPESDFNPIRAGFMKLLKLWIVDAFGQVKEIDLSSKAIISEELSTQVKNDTLVTLKPRITQPARLNIDWISADEKMISNSDPATNPVCGWILPNHLDNSIMIYNASGEAQGEIKKIKNPDKDDIQWFSAPGTDIQVEDIVNQQLHGFVDQLLQFGEKRADAFQELMDNIDETLWSIDPLGFRQNQSISVLIGRPLALANVGIGMEIYGNPAYSQSFNDFKYYSKNGFNSCGFEMSKWTVRMGDISQICDGLLGYFVKGSDNTYKLFHATPGVKEKEQQSGYVSYDHTLEMDFTQAHQQVNLTVLLDPRAGIHVTSGILPVTYAEIPPDYVSGALNKMYVTFGINPLISLQDKASIPLPTIDKTFEWSWVFRRSIGDWQQTSEIDDAISIAACPEKRYEISEGWLKLNKIKDS